MVTLCHHILPSFMRYQILKYKLNEGLAKSHYINIVMNKWNSKVNLIKNLCALNTWYSKSRRLVFTREGKEVRDSDGLVSWPFSCFSPYVPYLPCKSRPCSTWRGRETGVGGAVHVGNRQPWILHSWTSSILWDWTSCFGYLAFTRWEGACMLQQK